MGNFICRAARRLNVQSRPEAGNAEGAENINRASMRLSVQLRPQARSAEGAE